MKKALAWCMLVMFIFPLALGCAKSPAADGEYPVYQHYTDIPGVTKEDAAEIEALKAQYGSFCIAMNHSTEAFYCQDGSIGGYTSLFCEWLTALFGIRPSRSAPAIRLLRPSSAWCKNIWNMAPSFT